MNAMIENYLNGNLTDAKRQARRHSEVAIRDYLTDELGRSQNEARAIAAYLKGRGTFQAACDAQPQAKA